MSLTSSFNQPHQSYSRTTAVAFIVLLHAAAFVAFNNGIGSLLFTSAYPPAKYFDIKPDPKPYEFAPPPETPPVIHEPTLQLPVPKIGDITPDRNIETKDDGLLPPELINGGKEDVVTRGVSDSSSVSRLAILHRIDPAYPSSAAREGEEGTVLLEIQVDMLGHAMSVQVVHSSGFNALDSAAARAVKEWRFSRPSSIVRVRVPVTFKLSQRF